MSASLLVELFVEELPPKALKKLGESFASTLADSLKAQGLAAAEAVVTAYASPRRLAAHVTCVAPRAADKQVAQKLMPVGVALDGNGQATPALLKKLAAMGLDAAVVPQLKRAPDGKNEALFFDTVVPGAILAVGLQKALDEALAKLPIPKVMTYQLADGWSSVNFVRPAHGLVALHGAALVPLCALGLNSGRETQGHRFEARVRPLSIRDADSYASQMQEDGAVIASFAARRAEIVRQLHAAADQVGGGVDDELAFDDLLACADFILAMAPLTPENRGMFGAAQFAKMRPSTYFINSARGELVDTQALCDALRQGKIAYAALDVVDPEPLPSSHPLLSLPNVLITPHIGTATNETRDAMACLAAENLLAGLARKPLPTCVNRDVNYR